MMLNDFIAQIGDCDFAELSTAVADAIKKYKDSYGDLDRAEDRYGRFFAEVENRLQVRRRKSKSRKKANNIHTNYYNSLRRGDAQDRFVYAIYYWFSYHCETQIYADSISEAITTARSSNGVEPTTTGGSQPQLYLSDPIPLNEDNSNWLSPEVDMALPFTGRSVALNALSAFVSCNEPFLIWAISGPSGAGKTRLATHWMRAFKKRYGTAVG